MRIRRAASALVLMALTAGGTVASAKNLVVNGTFKAGNKGFSTGYTPTTMTPYLFQNAVHGIYAVEPAASVAASSAYGDWTNISADPKGGNGNVLVADAATDGTAVVWSEVVPVMPHTKYRFSFYGAEVSNACCSNATLASSVDGLVGATLTAGAAWQSSSFVWYSGSETMATLSITDTNPNGPYNDFAIDYLSFKAVGH